MIPEKLIQMLTDEQFEEFSQWFHDSVDPEEMTEEEEMYWHLIINRLDRDYMMVELEQFPRFIDIIREKKGAITLPVRTGDAMKSNTSLITRITLDVSISEECYYSLSSRYIKHHKHTYQCNQCTNYLILVGSFLINIKSPSK